MPNNNKKLGDLDLVSYYINKVKKDKFYGEIGIVFRAGHIVYFKKNGTETRESIEKEILKNTNNNKKKRE